MAVVNEWQRISVISDTAGFLRYKFGLPEDEAWAEAEHQVDQMLAEKAARQAFTTEQIKRFIEQVDVRDLVGEPRPEPLKLKPKPPRRPRPGRFRNLELEEHPDTTVQKLNT